MSPTIRNLILILILISAVIFLPALMGASMIDLPEEDDSTDTDSDDVLLIGNSAAHWVRIPVSQLTILLRLGISIFALFVVYLGGRSKHKRFNDRTIDPINVLKAELLKTALFRAVFNFLFFIFPQTTQRNIFSYLFIQTPIPYLRRY